MAEENDNICVGITKDGVRCKNRKCAEGDGTRCKTHFKYVQLHGPHETEINEIKAKWRLRIDQMRNQFFREHPEMVIDEAEELARLEGVFKNDERLELDAARERHAVERERLGHDPDADAHRRREAARAQRLAARRQRDEEFRAHMLRIRQENEDNFHGRIRDILNRRPAGEAPRGGGAADPRPLARFAADNQNVHTTEMVKQTKEVIKKVREIPVPPEYKWNLQITSKTPGEIIAECRLSIHASCQMLTQYSHATAIYDIEEGIYGKVLDSVWQFIKNSSDKDDLCRILKQEMEDNIGMCAQGNLTRLCNILAGYLDGVAPPESVATKMGRLLPQIMEIEDPLERIYTAFKIMKDNNVPFEEWDSWIEPFIDDEVEDSVNWKGMRDGIHAGTV